MSEVRIFRLSPWGSAGPCLYVPVSYDRQLEVVDAHDDVEGVRQVVEQWPEATFLCSPDLSEAAARLGLAVAPLQAVTEGTRIWTAITIAQTPDLKQINNPWVALRLMSGAEDFLRQDVPKRWPARLSIDIELRGGREARWFGALLSEPYPGLVLFHEPGPAKECALLDGDAKQQLIAQHDHLRVQFEPAPAYAVEWIRELYHIDQMPRLTRRQGGKVPATEEDALVMSGVLSALARVEDVSTTAYFTTRTPDREVRTFVAAGSPWPFVDIPMTT